MQLQYQCKESIRVGGWIQVSYLMYHVRLTIACCCCGNAPNPADAVAIGGPLEPFEGKCLKIINVNKNVTIEVVVRAKTVRLSDLLLAGPKLRLLARLARLESRSPVTSFPPEADRPWTETELVIRGDIPTGAVNGECHQCHKMHSPYLAPPGRRH